MSSTTSNNGRRSASPLNEVVAPSSSGEASPGHPADHVPTAIINLNTISTITLKSQTPLSLPTSTAPIVTKPRRPLPFPTSLTDGVKEPRQRKKSQKAKDASESTRFGIGSGMKRERTILPKSNGSNMQARVDAAIARKNHDKDVGAEMPDLPVPRRDSDLGPDSTLSSFITYQPVQWQAINRPIVDAPQSKPAPAPIPTVAAVDQIKPTTKRRQRRDPLEGLHIDANPALIEVIDSAEDSGKSLRKRSRADDHSSTSPDSKPQPGVRSASKTFQQDEHEDAPPAKKQRGNGITTTETIPKAVAITTTGDVLPRKRKTRPRNVVRKPQSTIKYEDRAGHNTTFRQLQLIRPKQNPDANMDGVVEGASNMSTIDASMAGTDDSIVAPGGASNYTHAYINCAIPHIPSSDSNDYAEAPNTARPSDGSTVNTPEVASSQHNLSNGSSASSNVNSSNKGELLDEPKLPDVAADAADTEKPKRKRGRKSDELAIDMVETAVKPDGEKRTRKARNLELPVIEPAAPRVKSKKAPRTSTDSASTQKSSPSTSKYALNKDMSFPNLMLRKEIPKPAEESKGQEENVKDAIPQIQAKATAAPSQKSQRAAYKKSHPTMKGNITATRSENEHEHIEKKARKNGILTAGGSNAAEQDIPKSVSELRAGTRKLQETSIPNDATQPKLPPRKRGQAGAHTINANAIYVEASINVPSLPPKKKRKHGDLSTAMNPSVILPTGTTTATGRSKRPVKPAVKPSVKAAAAATKKPRALTRAQKAEIPPTPKLVGPIRAHKAYRLALKNGATGEEARAAFDVAKAQQFPIHDVHEARALRVAGEAARDARLIVVAAAKAAKKPDPNPEHDMNLSGGSTEAQDEEAMQQYYRAEIGSFKKKGQSYSWDTETRANDTPRPQAPESFSRTIIAVPDKIARREKRARAKGEFVKGGMGALEPPFKKFWKEPCVAKPTKKERSLTSRDKAKAAEMLAQIQPPAVVKESNVRGEAGGRSGVS